MDELTTIDNLSKKEMTPTEYFTIVKDLRNKVTDEDLQKVYDNCLEMLNKYVKTGQKKGARKLIFHLETIHKERELVKMGIDQFVYKDDIEYYIKEVASDVVKIIDVESYEREIPDEIVEVIDKVKGIFDQLYIVFTDYTGEVEKKVQQERRDKDPILFGAFKDKNNSVIIDRFYFLGDWVDDYCDLTLDKVVNQLDKVGKRNVVHTISTPADIEEYKKSLGMLTGNINSLTTVNLKIDEGTSESKKPGFFQRVRSIFGKK